jgi:peptidoglycan/xylan/chitin deacetylase (PgdA/CDA1 family)
LLAAGARGTFFFNGHNWDCIYSQEEAQRLKYAYDMGHQIASHTWSHVHLNDVRNRTQLESEFKRINEAIRKITGVLPAFMRPPYGEYNEQVLEVAAQYGQTIAKWDFVSGDSVGVSASDSKRRYDAIAKQHPSTLLALNHEVYSTTASDVIPHAIKVLQGAGYKLVTLAECLGKAPYQHIGPPSKRDKSWTC